MITNDGQVKILDFGLAKLMDEEGGQPLGPTRTLVESEKPRTRMDTSSHGGLYVAGAGEGKKVDARTDIFSFGAVLYEMLTGQKAFHRRPRSGLSRPSFAKSRSGMSNQRNPSSGHRTNSRALLRKDPQRRWQSMSDLKVVLLDLKEDSESGKLRSQAAAIRPRRKSRILPIAATLLVVLAAAVILGRRLFFQIKPARRIRADAADLRFGNNLVSGRISGREHSCLQLGPRRRRRV